MHAKLLRVKARTAALQGRQHWSSPSGCGSDITRPPDETFRRIDPQVALHDQAPHQYTLTNSPLVPSMRLAACSSRLWTSLCATALLLITTHAHAENLEFRDSGFFASPSGDVKLQWDPAVRRFRLTTRGSAGIDFSCPASQDGKFSPWYAAQPQFAIDAAKRQVTATVEVAGGGTSSITLSEQDGGVLIAYANSAADSKATNLRVLFPVAQFRGKAVSWASGTTVFPAEFQADHATFVSDWENKIAPLTVALDDERTVQFATALPYKDLNLSDCRSWKEENYHLSLNMRDSKAALLLHLGSTRPETAPRHGNLISEGSSFETGPDGMHLSSGYSWNEPATTFGVRPEFDATTAVDGRHSLKLVADKAQQHFGRFTFVGVSFKRTLLERGKHYTMSAWLKADRPGLRANLFCGESSWSGGGFEPIPVTTEWARYHVEFTADKFEKSGWWLPWISFPDRGEGTLWVDAVQLEEGGLTDYQPAAAVEFGVEIATPGKLFTRTQLPEAEVRIRNNGATAFNGTMTYQVLDYTGEIARIGTLALYADARSDASVTLTLPELRSGYYRLHCAFPGEDEEAIFGVYRPQPLTRLPDDWPLASHNDPSPLTRQLGFGMVRSFGIFEFREIADKADSFDFTAADRYVAAAEANGLTVMPILGDFRWPSWAQKSPIPAYAQDHIAQQNAYGRDDRLVWPTIAAWKRYIAGVVGHYKGRITYFEIHNEPNLSMSAAEYTPYLKAAYEAAKEANPDCRIVGMCATSDFQGKPDAFMRPVLDLGGAAYADIFSVHMYDQKSPEQSLGIGSDRALTGWRALVQKIGNKQADFWHTEKSYIAEEQGYSQKKVPAPVDYCDEPQFLVKTQQNKADWLIRETLLSAIGGGHGKFFWFGQFDDPRFISHRIFQPYVLDHTEYDDSPKPELLAANGLACALSGMHSAVRQLDWGQATRCALFTGKDGTMAALWRSSDEAQVLVPVGATAYQALDFFGEPLAAKPDHGVLALTISTSPTYLRFPGSDVATAEHLLAGVKFAAWSELAQNASMLVADGKLAWRFALVNPQLSAIDADITVTTPPGWSVAATTQRISSVAAGARAETTFVVTGCPAQADNATFTFSTTIDGNTQTLQATCLPFSSEAQLRALLSVQSTAIATRVTPPGSIIIDGDLKDWTSDNETAIATTQSLADESEPGAWRGPYDSAAALRLRWDDSHLYLAARIFDDHQVPPRDAKSAYEWDCLELFLSPDGKQIAQGLLFPFPADHTGPKAWWLHAGSDLGSKVVCTPTATGYVLEAAIPWAGLGITPKAGASIPFSFALDDTDAAGQKRKSVLVWQGDTGNFASTKKWGVLRLVD